MSSSNLTSSSGLNSTSLNSTNSLTESSIGSPLPSNSSSVQSNADSILTPPPSENSPPPSKNSPPPSSLPSSSASPPPESASPPPPPPPSSSPPPSPPSNSPPPNASPPLPSPPPSNSPPPPPPPSSSSTLSPPPPPLPSSSSSQSPLPPPAISSPSPRTSEKGSPPPFSSSPASSPPPSGSFSSGEFVPPPSPLTLPPPGSSGSSSSTPPPPSQNSTSGLGTSPTSDRTSPSTPTSSFSPGSSSSSRGSTRSSSASTGTVIGVAVGGVFVIALIALVFMLVQRRKKKDRNSRPRGAPAANFTVQAGGAYCGQSGQNMGFSGQSNHSYYAMQGPHSGTWNSFGSPNNVGGGQESSMIGDGKSVFSYEELMEITNGFSRQNIIGEGGFGCVYKGHLPDGRIVAVKQLKTGSGQGDREFRAEVEIISRVHHRHLVSLVGYCISEQQRLLIYEFAPNKTLEHHLHGKGMPMLEWTRRVKIALGSAKGLAYLHEDCHPKIIHRDIKSANILLDDDFEAQVADFGLAKLNNDMNTHVSTRVMGTFGYLAPEYASSGKLTDRSDVFSFGVVLLELVTGRKPVDASQPLGDESLVEWARPLLIHALETGDFSELVDPQLGKNYAESEMFRMIEAAAACIRHSAPKRPRMVQVVRALDSEGEMSDLSNGVKFGQSAIYNSSQYNQDIMRLRRMALGSNDSVEYETSGEYSQTNTTSWKSRESSSVFTGNESETRAMNPVIGGRKL